METIVIKVNGKEYQVAKDQTILEACQSLNIHIPTLCYLKDINKSGACRMCLVEVKGARTLVSSCTYPIFEGMEVFTNTKRVIEARRNTLELILSNHSKECLSCSRNQKCELQSLAQELGIKELKFVGDKSKRTIEKFSLAIERDTLKCVLCGRCVETCKKAQGLGILGFQNRGFDTAVGPAYGLDFSQVNCMQCGQCVINCPTGALSVRNDIAKVVDALNDPDKFVVVQTAPAVRAALGEEFAYPIGTCVTGKMVAALKAIGFNRVYDTNFGADLTIMEEGYEFINRLNGNGKLPMITSCSPGWVRYAEFEYPDILNHLSSSKSPHMMLGAIIKSYFAKINKIDPKNIVNVSIMPCSAKKVEIVKEENLKDDGIQDVDIVLTTRECADLIRLYGIPFTKLADADFDQDLLGAYSGAAVIFGATGGVMEAALITVKEVLEGNTIEHVDFTMVRGLEGIKEASVEIAGQTLKIAIASGMANAKPLLEQIRKGLSPYHFIEIMGCPGGCINGGGQPYVASYIKNTEGLNIYREKRMQVLYSEDKAAKIRKSHENPQIIELYDKFLEKPNSTLAHKLLHTTYTAKKRYQI